MFSSINKQFLLHDSGPQDETRVIVFATLPGLDLLSLSDDWFCDETFSTAPNVFYQIYTTHASVEGCLIPIVYALLPDKKESTYCRLVSILKVDSPKRVTIDFEVAVRNSIIATHQIAQIQFCLFSILVKVSGDMFSPQAILEITTVTLSFANLFECFSQQHFCP